MKVAVVGATGLVGSRMLEILQERKFPISELILAASEKSIGKKIVFNSQEVSIISLSDAISKQPDIALFSAGSDVSKEWAPKFAEIGCRVIDNSSFWRMDTSKKLIIPEINADAIEKEDLIISNPNCSTIQMLVALAPLHKEFKIKRIIVSTYQSVTGTGQKGIEQLNIERAGQEPAPQKRAYKYRIDRNLIPQIDSFTEGGYTKEELKMVNETHKIMNDYTIGVSATTVRVPVEGGHSESVNVEFEKEFDLDKIFNILEKAPGVIVLDDTANQLYPMPIDVQGKDDVYVGRIRRDLSVKNGLNMWIVADNLRKGAATNAVQIAEYINSKEW